MKILQIITLILIIVAMAASIRVAGGENGIRYHHPKSPGTPYPSNP